MAARLLRFTQKGRLDAPAQAVVSWFVTPHGDRSPQEALLFLDVSEGAKLYRAVPSGRRIFFTRCPDYAAEVLSADD